MKGLFLSFPKGVFSSQVGGSHGGKKRKKGNNHGISATLRCLGL